MKEDSMLMCLICFVLGYLISRMMRRDRMSVGGIYNIDEDATWKDFINNTYNDVVPRWRSLLKNDDLWKNSSDCLDYLGCYDFDSSKSVNCPSDPLNTPNDNCKDILMNYCNRNSKAFPCRKSYINDNDDAYWYNQIKRNQIKDNLFNNPSS